MSGWHPSRCGIPGGFDVGKGGRVGRQVHLLSDDEAGQLVAFVAAAGSGEISIERHGSSVWLDGPSRSIDRVLVEFGVDPVDGRATAGSPTAARRWAGRPVGVAIAGALAIGWFGANGLLIADVLILGVSVAALTRRLRR